MVPNKPLMDKGSMIGRLSKALCLKCLLVGVPKHLKKYNYILVIYSYIVNGKLF